MRRTMVQQYMVTLVTAACLWIPTSAFVTTIHKNPIRRSISLLAESSSSSSSSLEQCKSDLLRLCGGKPSLDAVKKQVQKLEDEAELVGIGQLAYSSGLLGGEWECVYSPEDVTRSSPFFWAFRKAFLENSDQIFAITDAIPAPIKETGPATQMIDLDANTLVSRVKVATLGGVATSMMTTRTTILGESGYDGLRLKVQTTKPEDSTVLQSLGPLGQIVNDNSPPFPSGDALERVSPGSSEVIMKTTFCDESIRISKNADQPSEPYIWKRLSFAPSNNVQL